MKKIIFTISLTILIGVNLVAQTFDMSAQIRPRFENKNGYKSLMPNNVSGASFISQRTRLNFKFKNENLKIGVSLQDVRVWGDVSTLSGNDKANSFHQAWAEATLTKKVSLKLGRQEIIYDDHRIFGNVGWAQQARSHDAAIIKYKINENHKFDIGLALNADGQGGIDVLYSNVSGYKNFQYTWYHGKLSKKLELSFLALNTGVEYSKMNPDSSFHQNVSYMQTIGPRLTFKTGKFSANAAVYLQSGELISQNVNSLYIGANVGYKINDNFDIGAGIEYLSGKDNNDTTSGISSFAPLFGTNHKFNGWMDYFYVGNHGGNVGLMDINFVLGYKKNKFSAKVIPHLFSSVAKIHDMTNNKDLSNNLGAEIDLVLGYKIAKDIKVNAGFSMMLATESMEYLKGGNKDNLNTWAWVMFTFNPKIFSYTAK